MSEFIEQLETRRLFTSYAAAGTYDGTAVPQGRASVSAIIAATGTKKGAGKVDATLILNIADNSIVTGSLALTGVGTYALSGMVVEADVNISLELNGMAVGNIAGELKSFNKKLVGPFTDTVGGQQVTGQLSLINSQALPKKKTPKSSQNVALAPGVFPNETPPPVTSGLPATGDQTGTSGGDNSGTGTIDSGDGSVLG